MDEFYVGYRKHAPPKTAAWIARIVTGLFLLLLLLAVLLSGGQTPLGQGKFEFNNHQDYRGTLLVDPYPRLLIERPGAGPNHTQYSSWLLVAPFKFGADELVAGFHGQQVELKGALIFRDSQTMLELLPGSIRAAAKPNPVADARQEFLGRVRLEGEIVDSKCYLGVMKPGNAKPHRACAVRCVSGGIPPVLVVKTPGGSKSYYLLVDTQDQPINRLILKKIAVPVRVEGDLYRRGEQLLLKAEPESYQVLRAAKMG